MGKRNEPIERKQLIPILADYIKQCAADMGDTKNILLNIEHQNDPGVRRKPAQWFTDAAKEFRAIIRDEDVNLSAHRGLRI